MELFHLDMLSSALHSLPLAGCSLAMSEFQFFNLTVVADMFLQPRSYFSDSSHAAIPRTIP